MIDMSVKDYGFLQSFCGMTIKYPDMDIEKIEILDIAHSLAKMCRYNGHCNRFFSVASHSLCGVEIIDILHQEAKTEYSQTIGCQKFKQDLQKAFLMHDAHEAYVCDLPRPIKAYLRSVGFDYNEFEDKYAQKVMSFYGTNTDPIIMDWVDEIDNLLGLIESEMLYPFKIKGGWFEGVPTDFCRIAFKEHRNEFCELLDIYANFSHNMDNVKQLFIEESKNLGVV